MMVKRKRAIVTHGDFSKSGTVEIWTYAELTLAMSLIYFIDLLEQTGDGKIPIHKPPPLDKRPPNVGSFIVSSTTAGLLRQSGRIKAHFVNNAKAKVVFEWNSNKIIITTFSKHQSRSQFNAPAKRTVSSSDRPRVRKKAEPSHVRRARREAQMAAAASAADAVRV
ncbi:hypothetical protein FLAG1_02806 [Fusarium langsethiae]|uniref:Uncharacterized protein n=1 Tax=Fusarium langsethiae TaxID=179993 RepID=A0A0N0DGQ2_FUSLA|nr:hypothetical protein FLAG1_02806 [Fusarium langsethiae]GKU19453.1 unnamed protein product [Fusarium langsethiae]